MRKFSFRLLGIALIVTFCLAICFAVSQAGDKEEKSGSVMTKTPLCKMVSMAKITWMDAMKTALKKSPGGVLEIELEDENGYLCFCVEIVNKEKEIIEVIIDAGTGDILGIEEEEGKDKDDDEAEMKAGSIKVSYCKTDYPGMAKISPEEAVNAAMALVNGKFLSLELEGEDGSLVYEIVFTNGCKGIKEVEVCAGTGKILEIEEENCHKDD